MAVGGGTILAVLGAYVGGTQKISRNGNRSCLDHETLVKTIVKIETRLSSMDDGFREMREEIWPVLRKHERVLGQLQGQIGVILDDDTKGIK
jgi:hypothetical protein